MTFEEAAQAIREHFVAKFHDLRPDVPISFDNYGQMVLPGGRTVDYANDQTAKSKPWVRYTMRPADAFPVTLGGTKRVWRQTGAIIVQVFVPVGAGDAESYRIADTVAKALRGDNVNGVVLSATSPPQFEGQGDAWWQANITTSFEYDIID